MIPEPYLGLLVGAGLSIAASIITLVLSNYYSEKQWERSRCADKSDMVAEQVYSPLLFLSNMLPRTFGYLSGYLSGVVERKQYDDAEETLKFINEFISANRVSEEIKGIVLSKFNLINPKEFREDLHDLYFYVNELEWTLKEFRVEDFGSKEIARTKGTFKNLSKALDILAGSAVSLSVFLEKLLSVEKPNSELKYTKFFNKKIESTLVAALFPESHE